ncbi:NAD(P)-dependent oxidoreductase [Leifsonia sp. TF02-11]|uniref:NAD-dependent epimerase/dehydratase family protein n=1 Tax=Leifsonia sp. TF02-11 TaxID=2815212 RepID=UPI001FB58F92|nr:NAD(P)-dependent oxidoreductase [Leifsonia sp. TF02-11]
MTGGKVFLTGADGFIGSAIARALGEHRVDMVRHVRPGRREPSSPLPGSKAPADLAHAGELAQAMRGARIIIHAAAHVGVDPVLQREVNVEGTRNMVAAAQAVGAGRLIYLSTTGVYGGQSLHGETEEQAVARPVSTLSRSRYEAERIVLDAGGTVVRPNLVFGTGDRWFLGPLIRLMMFVGGWIGDGDARVSTIERLELGRLVARLALAEHPAGVYHAAAPAPVPVRSLVAPVLARLGMPALRTTVAVERAISQAAPLGVSPRQIAMVAVDNWLNVTKIWHAAGGVALPATVSDTIADWYAEQLTQPGPGRREPASS